ncbi:hypothetical protein PGO_060000 [Plasmodium gonderi]|uniref:Variable surface protein n=1 Tax=Plasmodium gonderi TaxID=77519 RepID=A0A1Y1JBI5_PLAGO|nr:hypothetical protein PGO_060000 [Plasmodium gonderi]GAW79856.1 hypothetical protein PGO_060000 [Plasmodium gonderi]
MKKNIKGLKKSLGKWEGAMHKLMLIKSTRLYIQDNGGCLETRIELNKYNNLFLHVLSFKLFNLPPNPNYNKTLKKCINLIVISHTFLLQIAVSQRTEAESDGAEINGKSGATVTVGGSATNSAANAGHGGKAVVKEGEHFGYFEKVVKVVSDAYSTANKALAPVCCFLLRTERDNECKKSSIIVILIFIMVAVAIVHYVYNQVSN